MFEEWWDSHWHLFANEVGVDVQDVHVTSLGFLDDFYFVCSCFSQAQEMLDDVVEAFARVGLRVNIIKTH